MSGTQADDAVVRVDEGKEMKREAMLVEVSAFRDIANSVNVSINRMYNLLSSEAATARSSIEWGLLQALDGVR